ncbi:MAG: hypothetical protein ACO3GL_05100 [Bacteroidia bacterium]
MIKAGKRRILFVPLDWGLGHATRLVPLIEEAVRCGDEVWIGGNGRSGAWLKVRFPDLPFEVAPEWTLQHHKHLAWDFLGNLFSFGRGLRADRRWANQTAERLALTHLVSDHRYGLYAKGGSNRTVAVLVLHQVVPALPGLWPWPRLMVALSWLLWPWFRLRLRAFDEVWIPDHGDQTKALAPALSHFGGLRNLGLPVRYLGWQSRWSGLEHGAFVTPAKGEALLVVLSGPEPARSLWEANLLQQWEDWAGREDLDRPSALWLVRGLPDSAAPLTPSAPFSSSATLLAPTRFPTFGYWNSPDDATLSTLMAGAGLIISRPGYSSLMDYAVWNQNMGKPALHLCLVPGQGHSEQAYLAHKLATEGQADFQWERTLNLRDAWMRRKQTMFTYGVNRP